jgi:hypothetical protein
MYLGTSGWIATCQPWSQALGGGGGGGGGKTRREMLQT